VIADLPGRGESDPGLVAADVSAASPKRFGKGERHRAIPETGRLRGARRWCRARRTPIVGPVNQSDPDLAQRRSEAFETQVLPEVDVLYRVALNLTGQPADAEDLVQDALTRAWRALDRFDGAFPRAWLLTILRNTHLNRVRARRPGLLDDPDAGHDEPVTMWTSAVATSPEDIVVGAVFDEVVADALAALSAVYAQAVRLVDVDELTYAEAAEVLGVPEGTVMSRVHRGRRGIRERLAAAGINGPSPRPSNAPPPSGREQTPEQDQDAAAPRARWPHSAARRERGQS